MCMQVMHKYIFRLLICILIVHGGEVKQKRDAAMKELCCFLCAEGSARQRVKVGGLGVVSATSQSILACQYLSSFAALGPESQPSVHLLTRALAPRSVRAFFKCMCDIGDVDYAGAVLRSG